jgi:hypothetical protein
MCSREQLPAGAAGVLLNQTHLFNDLFLPVGVEEKQMFDAIDGRRSVGEIAAETRQSAAAARVYFEKLWWYDQVVFDNSR